MLVLAVVDVVIVEENMKVDVTKDELDPVTIKKLLQKVGTHD